MSFTTIPSGPTLTDGDKGDVTVSGTGNTWSIDNNAVTDAKLRQSGALSVVGRSANSTGNVADISASAASDNVLRESGSGLGFGTVATGGLANNAVTNAKLRQSAALTVVGRSANSTGNVADIAAGTDYHVLRRVSSGLGFGMLDPQYLNHVGCGLYNSSGAVTIANATYTALPWDAESWDTTTLHDNSTNNTRITIPSGHGGKYLFTGRVAFDANGAGIREIKLVHNGAAIFNFATSAAFAAHYLVLQIAAIYTFSAGDYAELYAYQSSGGALKWNAAGSGHAGLQCTYLGK